MTPTEFIDARTSEARYRKTVRRIGIAIERAVWIIGTGICALGLASILAGAVASFASCGAC